MHTNTPLSVPWYYHVFVALFVVFFVGVSLVQFARKDTRFGWGMFSHETRYTIEYGWNINGQERIFLPQGELRGRTREMIMANTPLSTRYGLGALRTWVRGYVKYMYTEATPSQGAFFYADIAYEVNRNENIVHERIAYPLSLE